MTNLEKRTKYIGKWFGQLEVTAMEQTGKVKNIPGLFIAICKCHRCGKERHEVLPSNLKRSQSCGCWAKDFPRDIGEENVRFTGHKEIRGKRWSEILKSARVRDIPFDVTIEAMWDLFETQNRRCALTDLPIAFGKAKEGSTASLDRIDGTKGYEISNVRWVHRDVNRLKGIFPDSRLLELCGLIVQKKSQQL